MAWAPGHGVWALALSLTGSSCPVSGPQFPHLSDEGVGPGHPRNLKQKSIPELRVRRLRFGVGSSMAPQVLPSEQPERAPPA